MFFHGVFTEEWPNNSRLRGTKTGTPLFKLPPPNHSPYLPPGPRPKSLKKRGKSKCESHHPAAVHSFFFFSGTKQSTRPLILTPAPYPSTPACSGHTPFSSVLPLNYWWPPGYDHPHPNSSPFLNPLHTQLCVREGERGWERELQLSLSLSSLQTQKLFCFPLIPCTRFSSLLPFYNSKRIGFSFFLQDFFFQLYIYWDLNIVYNTKQEL